MASDLFEFGNNAKSYGTTSTKYEAGYRSIIWNVTTQM